MKLRKRRDPGIAVRMRHKREAYPCRSLLLLFEFQRAAGLDRSFLSMVEKGNCKPQFVNSNCNAGLQMARDVRCSGKQKRHKRPSSAQVQPEG
jgi:hypothetical protein